MVDHSDKDLVLLQLEGSEDFRDAEVVPFEISKKGVGSLTGLDEPDLGEELEELKRDGLVEEDTRYVEGKKRVRKAYFLTDKGVEKERDLLERLSDEKIEVKKEEGTERIKLGNMGEYLDTERPVIEALLRLDDEGKLDLTRFRAEESEIFIGRDEELARLKQELESTKTEGCRAVFIAGEAGVGKTSLVSRLKPHALVKGFDFLSGTCHSEIADPYLPFKDAFSKYMEEKDEVSKLAFIGSLQGPEIDSKKMFDAERKATFYETTQYIKRLASELPLLIFLDDMHWADRASLDILNYLLEKLEHAPVLLVCTYRPEEVREDHLLQDIMNRITQKPSCERLVLRPLEKNGTRRLISSILEHHEPPEDYVELVYQKTRGNPLFVKEIVRQMLEEGTVKPAKNIYPDSEEIQVPQLIQQVIERRIERLGQDPKNVLEAGSVIGEDIPFSLLVEILDVNELDLLDHIDTLLENKLWYEDPEEERFHFQHAIIHDTVYQSVRNTKRKFLHKQVSNKIRELFSDSLEERYPILAKHYREAGYYDPALEFYMKAGRQAEKKYAHDDAIDLYEKALEMAEQSPEAERLDVLKRLAEVHSIVGDYDISIKYLKDGLEETPDEKERGELYRRLGEKRMVRGEYEDALELIQDGLSILDGESQELCRLLHIEGRIYMIKGDYERAEDIFTREKDIAYGLEELKEEKRALHNLGTIALQRGAFEEAAEKLQKAIDLQEEGKHRKLLANSLNNLGIVYLKQGDLDRALHYYDKSLQIEKEIGNKLGIGQSLNNIGIVHMNKGELDQALDAFNESLEIEKKIGNEHGRASSLNNLGIVSMKKGELDKALEYKKRSLDIHREIDDITGETLCLTNIGEAYRKKGELEKALDHQNMALESADRTDNRSNLSLVFNNMGIVQRDLGNLDKALERLEESLETAREIEDKNRISSSLRNKAAIYRMEGKLDKAVELSQEAVELAEKTNSEEQVALSRLELAEELVKVGEIEKGAEHLDIVSDIIEKVHEPSVATKRELVRGIYNREKGDLDKASKSFENTEKMIEGRGDPRELPKLLYERAVLEEEKDDKERLEECLNEGLEVSREMGMEFWKERFERMLEEI